MKWDAISLVEAAYDLESDDRGWLARLLEQAAPRLDHGFGVSVSTYTPGLPPDESLVETRGMSRRLSEAMLALSRTYPEEFRVGNTPRGLGRCVTFNQQLGLEPGCRREFCPVRRGHACYRHKGFLGRPRARPQRSRHLARRRTVGHPTPEPAGMCHVGPSHGAHQRWGPSSSNARCALVDRSGRGHRRRADCFRCDRARRAGGTESHRT